MTDGQIVALCVASYVVGYVTGSLVVLAMAMWVRRSRGR